MLNSDQKHGTSEEDYNARTGFVSPLFCRDVCRVDVSVVFLGWFVGALQRLC